MKAGFDNRTSALRCRSVLFENCEQVLHGTFLVRVVSSHHLFILFANALALYQLQYGKFKAHEVEKPILRREKENVRL